MSDASRCSEARNCKDNLMRDQFQPQDMFTEATISGWTEGAQGRVFTVQPAESNIRLAHWTGDCKKRIDAALHRHGAILFRGFEIASDLEFSKVIESNSSGWAKYREPATPRTEVRENIFTSTEYPPENEIPLHNENSHCTTWPLKLYFYCVTAPVSGGQTPFADCRRVMSRLSPAVLDQFARRKWRYVRNFGNGLGFSWQKVFGAGTRNEVESYCRSNSMECLWGENDSLKVSYVRDAVRTHPLTGEEIWFNHGLFFNPISIEASLREMLLESFSVDELPYNTYYGDGAPVEPGVLEEIREAYRQETCYFDWRKGDVLLLDNMLVAHGRKPFKGPRRVLVGMTDSYPNRLS
jgi:alpha-ketoglutarate-dependent taurine dioxygenase